MSLTVVDILAAILGLLVTWLATRKLKQPQWSRKLWIRGIAISFIALGLLASLTSSNKISESFKRRSWDQVRGQIVRSSVIGQQAYRPNIVYQIESKGLIQIDSTDLNPASFGGRNARRTAAERIIADYKKGDSVDVWINPKNRSETALTIHPFWAEYMKAGFGYLLYLLGVLILIVGLKPASTPHK